MPKGQTAYGNRSLAAMGISLIITQDFYPLVLIALHQGQNAAWLIALSAALLAALITWPITAVLRRLPQGSLVDLTQVAVGRVGLMLYAIVTVALLCFLGGLILRETSEMALTAFFPHTPQTFATTALMLGAVYAAFGTGSSLVRFGRSLLGLLIIAVSLVTFGTIGWGTPRYLLPWWGPGPAKLLLSTPDVVIMYGPALLLLFLLAGGVNERQRLTRWLLAVPLTTGVFFSLVKANLVMVFPYPLGQSIPYPLHGAARIVAGGRFFERIEGIWLMVWVIGTMLYLGVLLYCSALLFTRAFTIPKTTTAVLPLATIILTTAFFSPDQATTIAWHEGSAPFAFAITMVIPLLLAGIAAFRLRGRTQ